MLIKIYVSKVGTAELCGFPLQMLTFLSHYLTRYFSYQVIQVPTRLYNGEVVNALTLMASQDSLAREYNNGNNCSGAGDPSGHPSGTSGVTGVVKPSKRYINILKEGELISTPEEYKNPNPHGLAS